jgi:hypothetical protein
MEIGENREEFGARTKRKFLYLSKYTILILSEAAIFILNLYADFFDHLNTLRDHKTIYYFLK